MSASFGLWSPRGSFSEKPRMSLFDSSFRAPSLVANGLPTFTIAEDDTTFQTSQRPSFSLDDSNNNNNNNNNNALTEGFKRTSSSSFWDDDVPEQDNEQTSQDRRGSRDSFPRDSISSDAGAMKIQPVLKWKGRRRSDVVGTAKRVSGIASIGHGRKRRISQLNELSPFAKFKLGEGRRKQLKSAISDRTKESEDLRQKVMQIGKIKEATIPELFAMAEACGVLNYAMELAEERADLKTRNKLAKKA